jgi:hypothetical protein
LAVYSRALSGYSFTRKTGEEWEQVMQWQFLMVPAAIIASAPAFAGAHYLTIEQAQELLFPGATFTNDFRSLTNEEIDAINAEVPVKVWNRKVRLWRVSTGGWFFIDQVRGKDDWVSYAIGLDETGALTGIEILVCWEQYNQIRLPAWRDQFTGARHGEFKGTRHGKIVESSEIQTVTGTTLSTVHVTEGVTRILATFAVVIAPQEL